MDNATGSEPLIPVALAVATWAVTAVTAQNTLEVHQIHSIPVAVVQAQSVGAWVRASIPPYGARQIRHEFA